MYDREFSANLIIASKGMGKAEIRHTAFGEIRSRNGANLKYTSNDAKAIYSTWSKHHNLPDEAYIYLEDPTKLAVEEAIHQINEVLSKYPQEKTGIDIFFAGHGYPYSGSFMLKDDRLSAEELIDIISRPLEKAKASRGLGLILDSCYAGGFLIDIIIEIEKEKNALRLFDALVSSMYDETSWELSFLEHGAFTFSFLNKGNSYFDNLEFAKSVENNDNKIITKYLQGIVGSMGASSVAFLTQGRQHSIDCLKGHHLTVNGHSSFSLTDIKGTITRDILEEKFSEAKVEIRKR
jgi:hypothetical protein